MMESKDMEVQFQMDRRKFFRLFGGGLAVVFVFQDVLTFAEGTVGSLVEPVPAGQVGAWIHITEDGTINVFTGKVEVGQNIRTSLSQQVAEELNVPMSSIKMIMGDTDLVPADFGTVGSRSTPQMGTQLRKAAATARQALLEMAGKLWGTDVNSLKAEAGAVSDPRSGKKISYGQLTKGRQILMPISDQVAFIKAADWKVAGKTIPKVNGRSFITGGHKYVSDMILPDMLHAKVLRPPAYGARLIDADLSVAKAIPGVVVVQEGNFIGVAAPTLQTAEKAVAAIKANWETSKQPSRAELFDYLVQHTTNQNREKAAAAEGQQPMDAAEMKLDATYTVDYIAHVPLEPRAALAQWTDGKLTVWTGTQRPFGVQDNLAAEFNVPKEKVRVIMPDTGSGYGGKHSSEAASEAARLAKAAGKPVKLAWTRKEEFTWAYFRPAGVIKISSVFNKSGEIRVWKFDNYNSGNAGLDTQYRIASKEIAYHPSRTPLKQGSYRGLASTANVFARESHIADMARMTGMDQLEFRLKNLDDPRLKAVLEAAAKSFGWNAGQRPAGHGYGIACGFEKGGYVATCAEVIIGADRSVKIVRLTEAFECGAIVNPHHLENQILGAIVQGIGGALFEGIDFENGKILNAGLSAYRVPRFKDVPRIDVVMVNRVDLPSAGAGEAPIVGVAPAIRNAILEASGIGLKTLPLLPSGMLA
jgi:nicotinate dehydrogenase subunit B